MNHRHQRSLPYRATLAAAALLILALGIITTTPATAGESKTSKSITPPQVVHLVEPNYPDEAKRAGLEGDVVIETRISATGSVESAKVVTGFVDGGLGLNDAALESVRNTTFRPGLDDGKPVPAQFRMTIRFKLDSHK